MTDARDELPNLWVRLEDFCVCDEGQLATIFREMNPTGFNKYVPASRIRELIDSHWSKGYTHVRVEDLESLLSEGEAR